MTMRQILKFGIGLAGFELKRKPIYSFEDITPHLMKTSSPLVFDVGANRGNQLFVTRACFQVQTFIALSQMGMR